MRLRGSGRKFLGGIRSRSVIVLVFALVLGAFVGFETSERALATTTYSWNGYAGNQVIYMTTGLTDLTKPYLVPAMSKSLDDTTSSDHNAINVISGGSQYATQTGQVFDEYYKPDSTELIVDVPIVAAGGGRIYSNSGVGYSIGAQKLSLTLGNVPTSSPTANAGFYWQYNSGYNVTGPNNPGTTPDQAMYSVAGDAAGLLPTFGFVIGSVQLVRDSQQLSGVDSNNLGVNGPGTIWETFDTGGGSTPQNVFTSNAYVNVHIPRGLFTTYQPTITVAGENLIAQVAPSGWITWFDGAIGSFQLSARPAVMISGTVHASGATLGNQPIILEENNGGVITDFQVLTDTTGYYRFFGRLNTPYTVSATQSTSFGPVSYSNSFTTPTDATSVTRDINLASSVSGKVTNSAGAVLSGAEVQTANPSGNVIYVTHTDSGGNYALTANAIGTYTVTALKADYYAQTKTVNVAALGTANTVPTFSLTPIPPDFTISTSCSLSIASGGSWDTCTISLASQGGFSGSLSISLAVTPAGSGIPTAASPSPISLAADGYNSFGVTVTSGSATGSFTVTVTASGGGHTHSVSFAVTVTQGAPPPPPCRCRPNCCV